MTTWIISDTHFGHDKMYKFTDRYTGDLVRPWAKDALEGDAIMREKWNDTVNPQDKVIHLGDVAMKRQGLKQLEGLHGRKILIRGNHDIFKLSDYTPYFYDIVGSYKLETFILSHYPIHPQEIPHWCESNIHGHTHSTFIRENDSSEVDFNTPPGPIDSRYTNVCVEHTAQAPIDFEILKEQIRQNNK